MGGAAHLGPAAVGTHGGTGLLAWLLSRSSLSAGSIPLLLFFLTPFRLPERKSNALLLARRLAWGQWQEASSCSAPGDEGFPVLPPLLSSHSSPSLLNNEVHDLQLFGVFFVCGFFFPLLLK